MNQQRNVLSLSGLRSEPGHSMPSSRQAPWLLLLLCHNTPTHGSQQSENGVNGSPGRRAMATLNPIWAFGSQGLLAGLMHLLLTAPAPAGFLSRSLS